jgi:phosphate/sulfate permease
MPATTHSARLDHRRRCRAKVSAVRWSVPNNIVLAWIITIPAAALIAALFSWLSGIFS